MSCHPSEQLSNGTRILCFDSKRLPEQPGLVGANRMTRTQAVIE